jgi:acetyl esterase/lipase
MKTLSGALAALALAGMAAASPAAAQISKAPPAVRAKIAEMGAKLDLDLIKTTIALYVPLAKAAPPLTHVKVATDIAYGPDAKETLDLYQPEGRRGMPIVVFVHGGGYVGGDKNGYGGVIYANVPSYFARHGILGVNANYRLAPQHPWPAGAEDVGKVVAWLKATASRYGGDPRRIFLLGHSAGATHVALYVLDASLQPKDGPGIAGAILVSGEYRLPTENPPPNVKAYFGADTSLYAARSPIAHVKESRLPLLLATAEYDPVFLGVPTYELAAEICRRDGKCPHLVWLRGHNHISEMASFDTGDQELGREIVDFVRATR